LQNQSRGRWGGGGAPGVGGGTYSNEGGGKGGREEGRGLCAATLVALERAASCQPHDWRNSKRKSVQQHTIRGSYSRITCGYCCRIGQQGEGGIGRAKGSGAARERHRAGAVYITLLYM
jgi:hypothetical protein